MEDFNFTIENKSLVVYVSTFMRLECFIKINASFKFGKPNCFNLIL